MMARTLCQRLLAAGVPAGPVRNVAEVWADDHARHRAMAAEVGGYKGWGLPIKFSRTPGAITRTPPRYGAHGREILRESGYSEAEIEALVARRRPARAAPPVESHQALRRCASWRPSANSSMSLREKASRSPGLRLVTSP